MLKLLRFWWRFDAPVDRRAYLRHGAPLMALKFAGDAAIVWFATGQRWWIGDYLRPMADFTITESLAAPPWMLLALALWTLPFLWIGVSLTGRRLADAGLAMPLVLLFFVPFANYALMLTLCFLPTAPAIDFHARAVERASFTRQSAAAIAIATGAVACALLVFLWVRALQAYSFALFFGVPFFASTLTAWIFARLCREAGQMDAAICALLMLACVALGLLAIGTEGAVCLLMASPLAFGIGFVGGMLGHAMANGGRQEARSSILGFIAMPALLFATAAPSTALNMHVVLSSVEINAAPDLVWPRVIAFSPIEPPTDWLFKLGVAYPIRARIEGAGVGAIRYCEFSTGAFVEPITVWDTNHRLAFDVSASPAPMREFSPYAGIAPPHLKGFLNSRRGEFRLVDLGGGRTRLEGRTWYTIDMGPEAYWQLYTDRIIHGIHLRVLDHIKREAESARR